MQSDRLIWQIILQPQYTSYYVLSKLNMCLRWETIIDLVYHIGDRKELVCRVLNALIFAPAHLIRVGVYVRQVALYNLTRVSIDRSAWKVALWMQWIDKQGLIIWKLKKKTEEIPVGGLRGSLLCTVYYRLHYCIYAFTTWIEFNFSMQIMIM